MENLESLSMTASPFSLVWATLFYFFFFACLVICIWKLDILDNILKWLWFWFVFLRVQAVNLPGLELSSLHCAATNISAQFSFFAGLPGGLPVLALFSNQSMIWVELVFWNSGQFHSPPLGCVWLEEDIQRHSSFMMSPLLS